MILLVTSTDQMWPQLNQSILMSENAILDEEMNQIVVNDSEISYSEIDHVLVAITGPLVIVWV